MGLPKNKSRKKLDFLAFFYLPPPSARPLSLKVLWHFRAHGAAPHQHLGFQGAGPGLRLTRPHSAWGPGACSGREPLAPPGLLAKQPWMMEPVSAGVRASSLRVPRGSPPACAVPPTQRGSPSLLLAAVTAAVRPLPPGMCHRPECSKETSHAGA